MTTTMKFEDHTRKLASGVSKLFEFSNSGEKFLDVQVKVGQRTFCCHKLILQLNSDFFADLNISGTVTLQTISSDSFQEALRFMYKGEVLLNTNNIEAILQAAETLGMNDLNNVCFQFMNENLLFFAKNVLWFWKLALTYDQKLLGSQAMITSAKCQAMITSDFKKLISVSSLINVSEEMMVSILSADNLNVNSEVEVCEILIDWIDIHSQTGNEIHPQRLVSLIRWSDISVDYIKSKLLQNKTLTSNPDCMSFLSKVLSYLLSGVQFEGLQTFHRKSTGIENCLVVTSSEFNDEKRSSDIFRISLQQLDNVTILNKIPTKAIQDESRACIFNNNVYVTGHGGKNSEVWRLDLISSAWFRCADMITGRQSHCSAVVDSKLYALGGLVGAVANKRKSLSTLAAANKETILSSVECYNTMTNKWSSAGNLIHAVYCAACVVYKNAIYIFGGLDNENKLVAYGQAYNPGQVNCMLLDQWMPNVVSGRAVLWETSVILMSMDTCFLYNFETKTWQVRKQFGTDMCHFGLVLDNQMIYVAGGGTPTEVKDKKLVWTCTDEIKSVFVLDIIQDKPVVWKHHAKLPKPAVILGFCFACLPHNA